jgi:hypothetical protein
METDPLHLQLFWIGDGPGESMLPNDFSSAVVGRFETLCRCLDLRLKFTGALASAFRDAVALTVTLPSALLLTQLQGELPPGICQALQDWRIPCAQAREDDWLKLEREAILRQLVGAGMAKWSWSGLRLAVLHIVAPSTLLLNGEPEENLEGYPDESLADLELNFLAPETDYWQQAQAFWYPL